MSTKQITYSFLKPRKKIYVEMTGEKLKQEDCVKYLGVYFDDQLKWNKYIETKLSGAIGALFKLHKYVPQKALISVYYSIVYSHLMYEIIAWENSTKTIMRKLQVKQNPIVKIICNKLGRKTRLLPLYKSLNLLNIENIYKLELAKFMIKIHAKNLLTPFFKYFDKVTHVHSYFTRSAQSNKYEKPRCLCAKLLYP